MQEEAGLWSEGLRLKEVALEGGWDARSDEYGQRGRANPVKQSEPTAKFPWKVEI